mmetsp:Transcript_30282/g.72058  ORF Transcript_30282/g.72058 Transcript_30282/m.72058 type:complete len:93 (+) Transcript_30282:67-345(+)
MGDPPCEPQRLDEALHQQALIDGAVCDGADEGLHDTVQERAPPNPNSPPHTNSSQSPRCCPTITPKMSGFKHPLNRRTTATRAQRDHTPNTY